MVFGMISVPFLQGLLSCSTVKLTTVYKEILKKHVVPNLRTAINQPAVFL